MWWYKRNSMEIYAPDNLKTKKLLKRLEEFKEKRGRERAKGRVRVWTGEDELMELNK